MQRVLVAAAAAALISSPFTLAQQATPPAARTLNLPRPDPAMTGLWDYNDALSLDSATGRPEQAPLSATQRRRGSPSGVAGAGAGSAGSAGAGSGSAGAAGAGSGVGAGTGAGAGTGTGDVMGAPVGSNDAFERSVHALMMAERRALVRDLLEVPEMLRVRVTDTGVTFVDDLQRQRTYPTNGKVQKYQLGAAQFEARAYWDGAQFRKDIEATGDFKMSELYFLSEDRARLFVVIRIGNPKRPESIVGVDRVYDRVGR